MFFKKKLVISQSCQIPNLASIYNRYFDSNGVFVEIGAYDGESYSNTSGLADFGWQGFYVEPVEEFANKCSLRHKRNNVVVSNLAISNDSTPVEISVGAALSTASAATKSAYGSIEWSKSTNFNEKRVSVNAISLDDYLTDQKIKPQFNLLVVDVEGFEENVFSGFSISKWTPDMMIVELNDYHSSFDSFNSLQSSSRKVRNSILNEGYLQCYADSINSIFIHPRIQHK